MTKQLGYISVNRQESLDMEILGAPVVFKPDPPNNFAAEVQNALSFDGTDDFVDIGAFSALNSSLDGFEFSCEFRTTDQTLNRLFGTVNDNATTGLFVSLNQDADGNEVTNKIRFFLRDEDENNLNVGTSNTYNFTDGKWHTLSVSRTGLNEVLIIIDGVEQSITYSSQQSPDNFASFQYPMYIGALNNRGSVSTVINGALDEVSFKDNTDTIIAYYPMDEGGGDTLADNVGSNDGTINGATWISKVDTSWDEVLDVLGYNVYLSDDGGSTFTKQNISLITDTEFIIKNIADGGYQAYVTAENTKEESDPSNIETFSI